MSEIKSTEENKKMTESIDNRLLVVINKIGHYIEM